MSDQLRSCLNKKK